MMVSRIFKVKEISNLWNQFFLGRLSRMQKKMPAANSVEFRTDEKPKDWELAALLKSDSAGVIVDKVFLQGDFDKRLLSTW